jgi:phage shock protein A
MRGLEAGHGDIATARPAIGRTALALNGARTRRTAYRPSRPSAPPAAGRKRPWNGFRLFEGVISKLAEEISRIREEISNLRKETSKLRELGSNVRAEISKLREHISKVRELVSRFER